MKTTKTASKTVNLIDRTFIAATNTVLYTFQSSRSSYQYFITAKNGIVDTTTHQDCIGYKQHGHCYHMDVVNKYEAPIAKSHKSLDGYDVVGAALVIFNQESADLAAADAYATLATTKQTVTCGYCGGHHSSSNCNL